MSLTGSKIVSIEQDWKYLCRPIDANYVRITDHNSIRTVSDKPHAEGVSWAYANLSSARNTNWNREKIKLVCRDYPFTLEDRIIPSKNSCLDARLARMNKGVHDNSMWEWDESNAVAPETEPLYNARVVGGKWDGKRAVNAGGHGFRVNNITGDNNLIVLWEDILVDSIDEDAFHARADGRSQRVYMKNLWTSGLDMGVAPVGISGYGMYLRALADSRIEGGGWQGALGTFIDICADVTLSGPYIGGASSGATHSVTMKGCKRVSLTDGFKILDFNKSGLNLIQSSAANQCVRNNITNGWIMSDNLDLGNTYYGVELEDSSMWNILQGLQIGYKNVWTAENRLHTGVLEIETCDYNEVGPNAYHQCQTADVTLVGVNSTDHQ